MRTVFMRDSSSTSSKEDCPTAAREDSTPDRLQPPSESSTTKRSMLTPRITLRACSAGTFRARTSASMEEKRLAARSGVITLPQEMMMFLECMARTSYSFAR